MYALLHLSADSALSLWGFFADSAFLLVGVVSVPDPPSLCYWLDWPHLSELVDLSHHHILSRICGQIVANVSNESDSLSLSLSLSLSHSLSQITFTNA